MTKHRLEGVTDNMEDIRLLKKGAAKAKKKEETKQMPGNKKAKWAA